MIRDYFIPLAYSKEFNNNLNNKSFGKNIAINGIDDFDIDNSLDIVIFSINDLDNNLDYTKKIRKRLYSLSIGDWNLKILDLGIFKSGRQHSDTQFALGEILNQLSLLNKGGLSRLSHYKTWLSSLYTLHDFICFGPYIAITYSPYTLHFIFAL